MIERTLATRQSTPGAEITAAGRSVFNACGVMTCMYLFAVRRSLSLQSVARNFPWNNDGSCRTRQTGSKTSKSLVSAPSELTDRFPSALRSNPFRPARQEQAMYPKEAAERQIERYRAMTGQQRLKIALDLHEFACNVAREGIRLQFPEATAEEVEQHLRRRIELSRQ